MATRRPRCRWCRAPSLVPLQTGTLYCQTCHRISDDCGYFQNSGNGNAYPIPMSSNTYPGYAACGRTYQPWYGGGVYQQPSQPYAPPAHGRWRKRALLCGITYKGHRQSLNGSINDVLSMRKLLVERFGFPESSILMLTEEEDYSRIPTKKNIRAALRWLVEGCQSGDSLVFHYSGHGSQVRDQDGDELDGYDESLMPVDYQTEGRILDDEINATIIRPLTRGVILHSIIDTCFSGTFLDLPNVCRIKREGYYKWEDQRTHTAYKGTSGGYAISISACDDHQNSGDTTAFTGTANGALTYSFVQTLKQEPRMTYGQLLAMIRQKIVEARKEVGLNSDQPHLSQEPQLSSSHKFDIHSKHFSF